MNQLDRIIEVTGKPSTAVLSQIDAPYDQFQFSFFIIYKIDPNDDNLIHVLFLL